MPDDVTTIAVLSHQIGELKEALSNSLRDVRGTLRDHGERITAIEERQIRADERERTEDRLRRALREERAEQEEQAHQRRTIALTRTQGWALVAVTLAAAVVAVIQTFH